MVTGSTCNAAVGLGQLKQQQAHFDKVIQGKEGAAFSEKQRSNMRYGTEHEIDGVATVVSRVIPVVLPTLEYYEEGCVRVANNDKNSFLVVFLMEDLNHLLESNQVGLFPTCSIVFEGLIRPYTLPPPHTNLFTYQI